MKIVAISTAIEVKKLYAVELVLGCGSIAIVYKIRNKLTQKVYAIKVFPISGIERVEEMKRITLQLPPLTKEGSNLIGVLDTYCTREFPLSKKSQTESYDIYYFSIVSDIYTFSLYDLLRLPKQELMFFPRHVSFRFFIDMLEALSTLHKSNIVHAGITPNEILFSIDDKSDVKCLTESNINGIKKFTLGGFRSAFITDGIERKRQNLYNKSYDFTHKSDVFSVGVIMFRLITRIKEEECSPLLNINTSKQFLETHIKDSLIRIMIENAISLDLETRFDADQMLDFILIRVWKDILYNPKKDFELCSKDIEKYGYKLLKHFDTVPKSDNINNIITYLEKNIPNFEAPSKSQIQETKVPSKQVLYVPTQENSPKDCFYVSCVYERYLAVVLITVIAIMLYIITSTS